jgi:hypothetical protein
VILDPGAAFGTGSHPTTRLCLGWLERTCARASRSSTTAAARASSRSPPSSSGRGARPRWTSTRSR